MNSAGAHFDMDAQKKVPLLRGQDVAGGKAGR